MAYYNHGAAMRKKECADKYTELKKHITSKDESGKLNITDCRYPKEGITKHKISK
jgi:hypothetical protein